MIDPDVVLEIEAGKTAVFTIIHIEGGSDEDYTGLQMWLHHLYQDPHMKWHGERQYISCNHCRSQKSGDRLEASIGPVPHAPAKTLIEHLQEKCAEDPRISIKLKFPKVKKQ